MKIDKEELSRIFKELKNGKQEAAQELYNKYKPLVYGVAFSIVKNKDDADDVTQNVFTKIIETETEKLPQYSEATWLYTVSKNESLLFLKKRNNNLEVETAYEIPDENDEVAKIIDKETYNKLIDKLNKKEKEIVSLKVIADLSFREISDLIGEKEGTTKWRYYKSVYRLKAVLSTVCMAFISLVSGLFVIKQGNIPKAEQYISSVPSVEETNPYSSETKSIYNMETINDILNNTNSIPSVTEKTIKEEPKDIPYNYIGYGLLGLSIVFVLTTMIIFFKKYQLKLKKKVSK